MKVEKSEQVYTGVRDHVARGPMRDADDTAKVPSWYPDDMSDKVDQCQVCGTAVPAGDAIPLAEMTSHLRRLLTRERPEVDLEGSVCQQCYDKARIEDVRRQIKLNQRELSDLESQVVKSIETREREQKSQLPPPTLGQRAADAIAKFGGSWTFVLTFLGILAGWIILNSLFLRAKSFDPYPFILLNLVLSCLAALQAPIIMMSQNRQAERDRKQAEDDYEVNLKAEIEVRTLHEKMDHLLRKQMRTLMDFQDAQLEMLNRLVEARKE